MQVACFAEGTRIETETRVDGPVESLRTGDLVVTVDGGREPIVWIGQRTVDCFAASKSPETVWRCGFPPERSAETFRLRDLYLSPDHAVFVNDVLVGDPDQLFSLKPANFAARVAWPSTRN